MPRRNDKIFRAKLHVRGPQPYNRVLRNRAWWLRRSHLQPLGTIAGMSSNDSLALPVTLSADCKYIFR